MLLTNDGPVPVLIRRPATGECAVIDWLNLTMHVDTFKNRTQGMAEKELQETCIDELNYELKQIFGFGIEKELGKGQNYYQRTFALQNDFGSVSIGGQQNTILLMLTGSGCTHANYGWEQELHAWLHINAVRPKITRIDYAFDDLSGELVSVDWADEQDTLGGFTCGGRPPSVEFRGNWKRPDGSGRTLYIGKRTSSKFCRFYEKGKELGDKESPWVRCEVEYKAKHYFLPLDALLKPSEYFLAAYPCFHVFDNQDKAEKFELKKQDATITWNKAIAITKHQFSKYLKAFRDFYGDDAHVLDMLMPDKNEYPKRLQRLQADWTNSMPPIAA